MKKLLILAYDFPPYVSVGGLRPYNWYKYLKEYGVEPIVVTRQWGNKHGNHLDYITSGESENTLIEKTAYGIVLRTPFKPTLSNRLLLKYGENKLRFVRKLLTAFDEIRQFITISGPKKNIYKEAQTYLQKNNVDAIIATGDPFVLFFYANKLSKKFDIPWIADYRDPWSQNKLMSKNYVLKQWNRYIEKRIVSTTTCVTTVSEFLKKKIEENTTSQPFYILPNGYDPEVIDQIAVLPQSTDKLTIAFVGTIYNWHPWKSFLDVFSQWKKQNKSSRIEIHFYGVNIQEELEAFIASKISEAADSIVIHSKIPNEKLLFVLAEKNVMLLFNDYSIIGTKIYDYLGIKRKIILCHENDEESLELKRKFYNIEEVQGISHRLQSELIEETNSGILVQDKIHLFQVLNDLWNEFEQNGRIECHSVGVENYSRKIQVEKLAEIVKNITNKN